MRTLIKLLALIFVTTTVWAEDKAAPATPPWKPKMVVREVPL